MQALLVVIAWMVSSISSASYTASTLPDIADEDFIKKCVQIHNQFRSKVNPKARNMLYMVSAPAELVAHASQKPLACIRLDVHSGSS